MDRGRTAGRGVEMAGSPTEWVVKSKFPVTLVREAWRENVSRWERGNGGSARCDGITGMSPGLLGVHFRDVKGW